MQFKPTTVIAFSIMLGACIILASVLYANGYRLSFAEKLPNCLRLRAGTASVEVRYPNQFISTSYNEGIRIKRRDISDPGKPATGDSILGVDEDWRDYTPVDEIVKNLDPGPQYKRSNLNGYDAGFAHNPSGINDVPDSDAYGEHFGISDYYKVPFGNRTFGIFFKPSELLPSEVAGASQMLQSISFQAWNENIPAARVEACD